MIVNPSVSVGRSPAESLFQNNPLRLLSSSSSSATSPTVQWGVDPLLQMQSALTRSKPLLSDSRPSSSPPPPPFSAMSSLPYRGSMSSVQEGDSYIPGLEDVKIENRTTKPSLYRPLSSSASLFTSPGGLYSDMSSPLSPLSPLSPFYSSFPTSTLPSVFPSAMGSITTEELEKTLKELQTSSPMRSLASNVLTSSSGSIPQLAMDPSNPLAMSSTLHPSSSSSSSSSSPWNPYASFLDTPGVTRSVPLSSSSFTTSVPTFQPYLHALNYLTLQTQHDPKLDPLESYLCNRWPIWKWSLPAPLVPEFVSFRTFFQLKKQSPQYSLSEERARRIHVLDVCSAKLRFGPGAYKEYKYPPPLPPKDCYFRIAYAVYTAITSRNDLHNMRMMPGYFELPSQFAQSPSIETNSLQVNMLSFLFTYFPFAHLCALQASSTMPKLIRLERVLGPSYFGTYVLVHMIQLKEGLGLSDEEIEVRSRFLNETSDAASRIGLNPDWNHYYYVIKLSTMNALAANVYDVALSLAKKDFVPNVEWLQEENKKLLSLPEDYRVKPATSLDRSVPGVSHGMDRITNGYHVYDPYAHRSGLIQISYETAVYTAYDSIPHVIASDECALAFASAMDVQSKNSVDLLLLAMLEKGYTLDAHDIHITFAFEKKDQEVRLPRSKVPNIPSNLTGDPVEVDVKQYRLIVQSMEVAWPMATETIIKEYRKTKGLAVSQEDLDREMQQRRLLHIRRMCDVFIAFVETFLMSQPERYEDDVAEALINLAMNAQHRFLKEATKSLTKLPPSQFVHNVNDLQLTLQPEATSLYRRFLRQKYGPDPSTWGKSNTVVDKFKAVATSIKNKLVSVYDFMTN